MKVFCEGCRYDNRWVQDASSGNWSLRNPIGDKPEIVEVDIAKVKKQKALSIFLDGVATYVDAEYYICPEGHLVPKGWADLIDKSVGVEQTQNCARMGEACADMVSAVCNRNF